MLDVGWGDLIDYLGDDPRTRSIVIYMESMGDPRSFLSAAREVALSKPIIVIKAGRSDAAAKAAASHTGALSGSDEVLEAAFRRCGVLRVEEISDLFYMSEVLAKQPRPAGPRLTILTNAGGPGVLATDALMSLNGQLAELSDATIAALNQKSARAVPTSNCYLPVSGPVCGPLDGQGRRRGYDSADPSGRRTPDGGLSPASVAAQRLFPLLSHGEPEPAHGARAVDSDVFH
jgi:acyl-CoA synthetase (NDP forming)